VRFVFAAVFLVACQSAAPPEPPPASPTHADIEVAGGQLAVTIKEGAPGSLVLNVQNTGKKPLYVLVGGDTINKLGRHDRYKITALDQTGLYLEDPLAKEMGVRGGNSMSSLVAIPAGETWTDTIDLKNYLKVEHSGRYAVRLKSKFWFSDRQDGDPDALVAKDVDLQLSVML
jgi:hypothetical protein